MTRPEIVRGVARLNAKTVADAEAAHCRRLGIASLDVDLPVPAGPARLTPECEAEIAARVDAAHPGPWRRSDDEGSLERYVLSEDDIFAVSFGYRGNNTQAEADFIAHARADVPALLAELAAVRKERDEAQAELEKYVGKEPTVAEEMAYLSSCLTAVHDLCDEVKRQASRWDNPRPVPEWVAAVEKAAAGERPETPDDNRRRIYIDGKGDAWISVCSDEGTEWVVPVHPEAAVEQDVRDVADETGSLREIGRCW